MATLDRLRPGWLPGPLGLHRSGTGGGRVAPGFEDVARRFTDAIGSGRHGGVTIMRNEDVLVDIHAGWSDAAGTRRWTPDTVSLSFSTTKGLASTVIHASPTAVFSPTTSPSPPTGPRSPPGASTRSPCGSCSPTGPRCTT